MGVGKAIGFFIGIIIIIVILATFSDMANRALAYFTDTVERQSRVIIPVIGEELCDMNLTVYGALDVGAHIADTNRIYLNSKSPVNIFGSIFHPEVAQWEWLGCFTNGQGTLANLVPTFHTDNLQSPPPALAIVITPISTKMTLELERQFDGGLIQKSPEFVVTAPSGSPLPYTFTKTYHFDNIPRSNYDLKICSSSERINDLPFGECYFKAISRDSQFIR